MSEDNTSTQSIDASPDIEQLRNIRTRLDELRNDRDHYIKASDIEGLFLSLDSDAHVREIDLRGISGDFVLPTADKDKSPVSQLLEEVLLLLSLSYMTIGKNNELPAVYSTLVVIKTLLYHLKNAGAYSRQDLKALEARLDDIARIIENGKEKHGQVWFCFFKSQLEDCRRSLVPVKQNLDGLSYQLDPLYEKLVSLIRQITAVGSRPKVAISEIKELQEKLFEIESSRVEGNFLASDGTIPEGQEFINEILKKCHFIADSILSNSLRVDPSLLTLNDELVGIKGKLEQLMLTQAWSMRETDLFDLLQQLRKLDGLRVDDMFVGIDGTSPEEGQKFLLYLLRKSYALIYELLHSSKPISESLQPIFNQLSTLKKCLLEVQSSGGLASIDNLRNSKDGAFHVGKEIPEGQGAVNSLLEECYEICHGLRCQVEDA
ncbi:hypothetical protein TWF481_004652 [Arthrobotrys musiformis]|uniref:Uncharacterized protein n=1 Tax=Arthrobotrys musiformis TaxID=47236 RepID=A0AAV9WKK7_9PEZI